MGLALRQVAIVASDLHRVAMDIGLILNLEACYTDPGVEFYGLKNTLWPLGRQFIEVVAPIRDGTTGGRYLEKRGGDNGYLICTQADDLGPIRKRAADAGVRIITEIHPGASGHEAIQLHPADTGGCIWEIDCIHREDDAGDPWPPAGPQWQAFVNATRVREIVGIEFQSDDPERMASLWSRVSGLPVARASTGLPVIEFDGAQIRFAHDEDGRGPGFSAMTLRASDAAAVLAAAQARDCRVGERQVRIGGVRIDLQSQ